MIFVWRGWGPLAIVAIFLPCIACAGLIEWNPPAAMLSAGALLLAGGALCRHYGRKWNQGTGYHSMYWMPLETWGWIYIVLGGFFALGSAAGLAKKALIG